MLLVDIVLILLLLGFVLVGSHRGFVSELGRVLGAVGGFIVARLVAPYFGGWVDFIIPGGIGIANFVVFIIAFIVVERLIRTLFGLVSFVFNLLAKLPLFSTINSIFGALLGFAEGVIILGTVIYISSTFHINATLAAWLGGSSVAKYLQYVFSLFLSRLM